MASSQLAVQGVKSSTSIIVIWTLCATSTLFLASRCGVRISTKGHLMANDYFLVVALPALYIGAGLLQSCFKVLLLYESSMWQADQEIRRAAPRLTASIEMLWITIYCVKFCFLAQFKFHKPPYAYVSIYLTRYYWASIGISAAALLFTLIQPLILCSSPDKCRYFQSTSTVAWEVSVTIIDIVTDILVILIPICLINMANFTRSRTIINGSFKSLSIVNIAIASTRLALQYDAQENRIHYVAMTFWLTVEAAVALIMASISSWRILVIDHLAKQKTTSRQQHNAHKSWTGARRGDQDITRTPDDRQQASLSDIPMLSLEVSE